jgi:hypothetical protein
MIGAEGTSGDRDRGRDMGDAFQGVIRMEYSAVICSRASGTVSEIELECDLEMSGNERIFVEACEAVDVFHHSSRPMKYLKEISEKLLGPTPDLMDWTIVLQDLLDGATIAEPEEFRAPEKLSILADCPASAAGFADKGMVMTFPLGAAA